MDEKEFNLEETVKQLSELIPALIQKIDEQQARIDELDSVLYDGLIGPANDAIAENEYNNALSDFRTKYSEKLGPFESATKAIEGDDFDVYKNAFDSYNEGSYDFSPDEYVDKVAASLTEQIARIKEVVAEQEDVSPEDVEVEVNAEDGEVEVAVDNETTEEEPAEEEPAEEETKEEETKEEETIEDFEDSLKKEAEKDKNVSWIRG